MSVNTVTSFKEVESKVIKQLIYKDYDINYTGFKYITYILAKWLNSEWGLEQPLFYSKIAEKFESSYSRVERNIRHFKERNGSNKTNKNYLFDLYYEIKLNIEENLE